MAAPRTSPAFTPIAAASSSPADSMLMRHRIMKRRISPDSTSGAANRTSSRRAEASDPMSQ
ncbi:MAG: hypothetical protein BWY99_02043 [Synergistetes bacterium ADurb.BinA166]|nr:MAG: hypothetical protein BWY99_02043 [Synergistetes bacterium ADurb.BinA166]